MSRTILKRSAATLGVVSGLLAAAAPASAEIPPTTTGVVAPHTDSKTPASGMWVWHEAARTGLTPTVNGVLDTGMFEHEWLKAATEPKGTQIGSEGRKP